MKPDRSVYLREFLLPLGVILLVSALVSLSDFDRTVARLFFDPETHWPYEFYWLWDGLYRFGGVPAGIMALGGLLILLAALFLRTAKRFWRPAVYLLLLLALGPGLLVHNIGKDMWGRPRPVDTVDFGGFREYHHVYQRAGENMGKSFPSGHAAVGFYTLAPFYLLRRRNRRGAQIALIAGSAYGLLMSVGRMAQGGHYLTDTLWSWYLVTLTGGVLYYLLEPDRWGDSPVLEQQE